MAQSDAQWINLLGALGLGLCDAMAEGPQDLPRDDQALVLLGAEAGLAVAELAQILGLSHAGAVRLAQRLQAEGWVEGRRDAQDGRVLRLFLTKRGGRKRQAILQTRAARLAPFFDALSPAERQQMGRLMDKILRAMTHAPEDAFRLCRYCDEDSCAQDTCPVECRYQDLMAEGADDRRD